MDAVLIHKLSAQRFSVASRIHLADFDAIRESAEVVVTCAVDRATLGLRAWCLAEVHEAKVAEVERFASWWDHFKDAKFPLWLLSRFPAKRVTVTVFEPITVRVCPHIHIPTGKSNTLTHMAYLNPDIPWKPE